MFATALKPTQDIIAEDPVWFPVNITFEHFTTAVEADNFWTLVGNSLTVTLLAVLFSLVLALAGAFALARMRFKGRRGFIVGFMVAQMAPWEVMVIAIYFIVRDADMLNSLIPLTLFYMVMVLPFTLLTLRGFVAAVPKELEESAMVDGCTRRQAFMRVDFAAARARSDVDLALRLHHRVERVPAGAHPQQGRRSTRRCRCGCPSSRPSSETIGVPRWPRPRSSPIPILILFVFLQRRAVSGLTAGAVKG